MAFLVDVLKDYLETDNVSYANIMADYLEDNKGGHPELTTYLKRLRSGKIRTRTMLDVCIKFGDKKERKWIAKLGRILLKDKSRGARHYQLKILRSRSTFNSRVKTILSTFKFDQAGSGK